MLSLNTKPAFVSILVVLVCVFAGGPAWLSDSTAAKNPKAQKRVRSGEAPVNVLLIVVDTQRADFTTPYGAENPTTPFLESFARQSVLFKNAFSTAPWTVPSMFSMVTGLYPSEHGMVEKGNAKKRSPNVLPEDAVTLAEHLEENGYTTFGINTNRSLNSKFGFSQGFNHFVGKGFAYLPFPNKALESLLPKIQKADKYFVWLHYFDPHQPYRTHFPWFGRWNKSKSEDYTDFIWNLSLRKYRAEHALEPEARVDSKQIEDVYLQSRRIGGASFLNRLYKMLRRWPEHLNEDEQKFIEAAYMSSIRKTDEAMKDAVSSLGIDDNTLVIVTADHGEEIFDHGDLGHHADSLYQELIHVPLLIRLPWGRHAGTVIEEPVSTVDLLPTLLDLLNIEVPKGLSGVSLKPLIEGKKIGQRSLFAEGILEDSSSYCIVEYPWKYIYYSENATGELFNLLDDSPEKNNLEQKRPEIAAAMRGRLLAWTKQTRPRFQDVKPATLSIREIRMLKRMGYLQ